MLHTLRQVVNDDEKWRSILRGLNKDFYHQNVTTKQIEDYIISKSGLDLQVFFDQYLRTTQIPKLEYTVTDQTLKFRYMDSIENFQMPLIVLVNGQEIWIHPTSEWKTQTFNSPLQTVEVKADFYINSEKIVP